MRTSMIERVDRSEQAEMALGKAKVDTSEPDLIEPPTHPLRMLRFIGPGLIVAGSIVGSGELIATTKTGAEAGFSLLWLILLGCVVKVFTQVELGRYAIISGKPTLQALDEVPGPRIRGRGNWLVWYWLLMWLAGISQLGGIVGGVGQALAISLPVTQQGQRYNEMADAAQLLKVDEYILRSRAGASGEVEQETIEQKRELAASLANAYRDGDEHSKGYGTGLPSDTVIWATIIAVATSVILAWGRYGLIQSLSTVLVAAFTLLTFVNLVLLQEQADWRVSMAEFWGGLWPQLPETTATVKPIGTALATFGIIGVGAAELVGYPYWCLERGYARFTGANDGSPQWAHRASGWMRVMRLDAWGSMVVYTFATIAFYLLGAAVLNRVELNPEKDDMVRTLAVMFKPVFSDWAATIFLFGAFAVLYSTFFVANASHARTFADAMRVIGLIDHSESTQHRWVRILSGVFPILCLLIFVAFPEPAQLVLLSGVTQGVMLPMLAAAALYFRYFRSVDGMRPGRLWDYMLWLSAFAMLMTGAWTVIDKIAGYVGQ